MPETNCKFCEQLKNFKDDFEYYSQKRPSMKNDCKTEITVAIIDNHYFKDEYSGRASFDMGLPNFCPMCGRAISQDELKW